MSINTTDKADNKNLSEACLTTELSKNVTVREYLKLEKNSDRDALSKFIIDRFEERFFNPITSLDSSGINGFSMMAIACLTLETLQAFYEGLEDTKNQSRRIFESFFEREKTFSAFISTDDWFFIDIRCGILHQAETRGGWKIRKIGELVNEDNKTINAHEFVRLLKESVVNYSEKIKTDDTLWDNFKKKMKRVYLNCEPN